MRQWMVALAAASIVLELGHGTARAWDGTAGNPVALTASENLSEETRSRSTRRGRCRGGHRPRVLLVSAKASVRTRWRRALQDMCVINEESDRDALPAAVGILKPEVLLLDLSLPKLRRAGDIGTIQQASPGTAVLLLAHAPDKSQAMSVLKAAARGYCSARIAPRLLRRAVEKIHSGEIWAGREVLSRLVAELALFVGRPRCAFDADRFALLTPREREIAGMVTEGAPNKEIAARLNIREGTVKARLATIFRKLGCSNRVQLALIAGGSGPSSGSAPERSRVRTSPSA
jgi:two-component system, NarL family, nitrate/nitrite response regulator NarL